MKLGAGIFVALAVAATGCASSTPAPAAKTAQAPVVSTTRLTSADLAETEYAPLVGKSQLSTPALDSDKTPTKEEAPTKDGRGRREGNGFSGWK